MLSQAHYIQATLKELKLEGLHTCRLPLTDGAIKVLLSEHIMGLPMLLEITLYQCIVDKLLYTAMCTCFDIAFSVMAMAKYILGYLKYTLNTKLVYHISDSKKVTAYAYVNADFANAPGRKSVLGMALSINYCLIVWQSKKQLVVTTSTSKVEYITLFEESKEVYWIRRLLFKIGYSQYGLTLVL
jgi:hypothetical protein